MTDWRTQVQDELDALAERNTVDGVWRRDPATWVTPSPGGTPASKATGWLDLPGQMAGLISELNEFTDAVRADGFTDVILLGMGGSSLGPLVIDRVFGTAPGYLNLHVLDSTLPGQITAIRDRVDLRRTLILISSKSGTTMEPLTLARYFRQQLVEVGVEKPDEYFVAVTDAGSSLDALAKERGFRHSFNAPSDVGGRFSVLSYFGLLHAALIGLDIEKLCGPAVDMAAACGQTAPENPGALLGATLGALAACGRDKVTIVTSPGLSSFGLWVEQLLAESTGKNGRGLVPVAQEPLYDLAEYAQDRNFVYVRLSGDDNSSTDAHVDTLERIGQPVTRLELADKYDIGAEFFRWEFAVAVAATSISVYPFDQPDVESGKELTRNLLAASEGVSQALPDSPDLKHISGVLNGVGQGDYVAILGYIPESDELDSAVTELRTAITKSTGAATTFGYGPRYLHSTGQLHKGGPGSVIGLVLVAGNDSALATPRAESGVTVGNDYGFESLFIAQVMGDVETLHANGHRNTLGVLNKPYPEAIRSIAESLNTTP
jgi:glucose-6-phosphate isomerase